jgi:tetratricopeptide (TPR) repeat protein
MAFAVATLFEDQTPAPDAGFVSPETLATCRMVGAELYEARNLPDAESVALGLIAAAPKLWYHHSLLAAILLKQGRYAEALAQIDEGLGYLPGQVELLSLRTSVLHAGERLARGQGGQRPTGGCRRAPEKTSQHVQEMLRIVARCLGRGARQRPASSRLGRACTR